MESEPERIQRLWSNTRHFQAGLRDAGFTTGASQTPITPIHVGDAAKAFEFSRALFESGVFATGIGFPTVPQGKARIRAIVTAAHTLPQLERALDVISAVAKRLQILP
jgi:glycine C-acetyltransferase